MTLKEKMIEKVLWITFILTQQQCYHQYLHDEKQNIKHIFIYLIGAYEDFIVCAFKSVLGNCRIGLTKTIALARKHTHTHTHTQFARIITLLCVMKKRAETCFHGGRNRRS